MHYSDGFKVLKTSKLVRPQTASLPGSSQPRKSKSKGYIPKTILNGKNLIKVPEDNFSHPSEYWKKNRKSQNSTSANKLTPQLLKKKDFYNQGTDVNAENFIKRIEKTNVSNRGLRKKIRESSKVNFDVKTKYKMMILNWGKELEKHDKILEKFHIFAPLKYDIDATFHKLFSNKSQNLINQKLTYKKNRKYMKAGYLENEIDLMFDSEHDIRDINLKAQYEKGSNKDGLFKINNNNINFFEGTESVQIAEENKVDGNRDLIKEGIQEAVPDLESEVKEPLKDVVENKEEVQNSVEDFASKDDVEDNLASQKEQVEEDQADHGSAYSSPFKQAET